MMRNKVKKRIPERLLGCAIILIMMFTFASCGGEETQSEPVAETQISESAAAETTQPASEDIGFDEVREIVLDRVPGATESNIYELERDYDDGMLQYEGSVYYDGYEYEFEINGKTGDILQWEIDD